MTKHEQAYEIQTCYQNAIKFAARKHHENGQLVPGTNLPYIVHVVNVTMEVLIAAQHTEKFNTVYAVQVALLHDTLEDTNTTKEELIEEFGVQVTDGVEALTKDLTISKELQMSDSLQRILKQPIEAGAVKMADRITNLQKPPADWTVEKKKSYIKEAELILKELGHTNFYLAERLKSKIEEYGNKYNIYI